MHLIKRLKNNLSIFFLAIIPSFAIFSQNTFAEVRMEETRDDYSISNIYDILKVYEDLLSKYGIELILVADSHVSLRLKEYDLRVFILSLSDSYLFALTMDSNAMSQDMVDLWNKNLANIPLYKDKERNGIGGIRYFYSLPKHPGLTKSQIREYSMDFAATLGMIKNFIKENK